MDLKPQMFKKILPLPITVITTIDINGVVNAAPYSCVMPILRPFNLITIASALHRDTLHNIRETGEFVVNIIGEPEFKKAMGTARNFPPEVNELEAVGIESIPSMKIKPPRMKDAIGWMEAVIDEEILRERYSLIIGKVVCSEINDTCIKNGRLSELPAVMLLPEYRIIGERIIGNAEETMKLFLP
jgi:flavin reductase (DIM6/NTAB) family NADH-FMN oxidoreductase RutF